jgi:drug/metabolite transporter (DMT)-like permease
MVCDLCLFKAYGYIGARLAMLLLALSPLMTGLGAMLIGQRMGLAGWLGMAVTLAGVTWVALERLPHGGRVHPAHRLRGVLLCVLAAAGQGTGIVLTRYGMDNYDPVAAAQIRVLVGMAGFAVLALAAGWRVKVVQALRDRKAMALIVAHSLLGPFLGVTLQLVSMEYIPAGITATLCSIVPVTIIPLAVVIQKERVSLRAILGACLAVAGIAILMWPW